MKMIVLFMILSTMFFLIIKLINFNGRIYNICSLSDYMDNVYKQKRC